jgi:catechol 2,3-dioxygenase-like lactoylglutathione lyase family enzyme
MIQMASSADYVLDHVIVFVADLAAAERAFTEHLGLQITSHADHPGFGTRNAAIAFQLAFFELLTEDDPAVLRSSRYGRLFLERHDRRGDGPAVFVFQTASFDDVIARCKARGGLCEDTKVGYSRGADGIAHEWKAALMPGVEPVYLDPRLPVLGRARTRAPKIPGDHPLGVRRIEAAVIAVRDLDAMAELYDKQLGLGPSAVERHGDLRTLRFPLEAKRQQIVAVASDGGSNEVTAHLERHGEGVFAVQVSVDDLDAARRDLERRGARPRPLEWLSGLQATNPDLTANTRLILCQA